MARWLAAIAAVSFGIACDRNVEPYDPAEQPRQPDLSRIFPAGAQQAERPGVPMEPPPAPGRGAAADAGDPTADAPPIRGRISVPDEYADALPRGAVLFLMARRGDSGPPLAVQRIDSPRFPFDFAIGPGDRMLRSLPFAGELRLSARLDGDGDARSRSPGDLQGSAPGAYEPGATGVEIVLGEVL